MSIVQSGLPLALSMPFVLAAWIAYVQRYRATVNEASAAYGTGDIGPANTCFAAASTDLNVILREAAVAVNALAHASWVKIELAVGAGMVAPTNANALRTALHDALLTAIHAAPGGQVLVTAAMSGSRLYIRITDDGPEIDQRVRERSMRRSGALIVSQGGSVAVAARPGQGTTLTIEVPMPATAEQPACSLMQLTVLADQAA